MNKFRKIIISSSNSKYFNLLQELLKSLIFNNILDDYDFGILDAGLTSDQINFFSKKGIVIKEANWDAKVPNYKIRGRNHLKTQFARAYLPDYFPNYNVYIWLDADTWINHKETFLLYEKGCLLNKLCITPQVDRAYGKFANVDWFLGFPKKIRTINYKNISKSISRKLGREYSMYPTLNAGVFAINDNANLWNTFQKNIEKSSKKGRIFGSDQVALALSVYKDNLPTEFLPAYTNWMCEFHLPIYDNINKLFVEPYIPYHPIGLMHLAGLDKIRENNTITSNIKCLNGNYKKMSLRYGD